MLNKIVLYSTLILVLFLFQTCTKKNDFLLQYKPNIIDINPIEGYPESLITIKGKGFSSIADDNKVTINNIEATVVEATTTELKVVVPEYATTGKIKIYIYYKNILIDSTISTQNFIIHNNYISTPIIYNFLPSQANFNTLVLLNGKNFSNATSPNSDTPLVVVGVDTMQVKAFTDTSILFLISKPLQVGEYVVSVIKKNKNDNKPLLGFSKNNLAIVASSLQLKETDIMIGDSLHIMGRGLLSAMNLFLSIGNNKVLCPITRIHDTLLAGKITNDIFQYINPKTSDVFNVSVLFNNQQTLSAGSLRISIASSELIWLEQTSVTNIDNINIKYNVGKIPPLKNAILYLKINNNIVSQSINTTPINTGTLTFDNTILKNILGVNDNSKIVQAEIKVVANDGNQTTYFLGNLTINAVPVYNIPFKVSNNLKANDVITITGTHIKPDVNLYQLIGFSDKAISATTATSTAITFKIPTDIPGGNYSSIKLQIGATTDANNNSLTIIPTITNITPLSGGDSTILTIAGYNLYEKNKIYFDTISVNKFEAIASPFNSLKDTISSKNLVGNTAYVVGIGNDASTAPIATASQTFLYTISQFKVFTNNINTTTATDGDSIKVSGKSIQGKNIILKYNNIQLSLPVIKNNDTLKTKIVEADIATFNIPDNATNVQAQVYVELTNGTQILAGSIMVKPTPIITGINPNTGSVVKYNDLITITGKHLSSNLGDFELKLGTNSIPITLANGSSIQFRIPGNIEGKTDSIYINMNTIDLQQGKRHHYLTITPTITSISPTSGSENTKITIQGYNFGNNNNNIALGNNSIANNIASTNNQTITFDIGINNLEVGSSYPVKVTTTGGDAISTTLFTYTLGNNSKIVSDKNTNTITTGDKLHITNVNLTGIKTIILKYGNSSISLDAIYANSLLKTKEKITATDIQSLNIPDNKASDVVQVYLQTGSTQTLAGSIIVKPTAEITGINPNIGSIVKYNDLITITGKHLSSNLGDFELKLGTNTIPITLANGSSIQFKIPTNIASSNDSIYITMLGNDLQQGKLHHHIKIAPTITSISPTSGTNNTLFTIQGYNFDTLNTIYFGNQKPINSISSSNSFQTISFSIPDSIQLQAGVSYPIKVKTDIDSVVSSTAFTYTLGGNITIKTDNLEPTILSKNNLLTITGNNLTGINNIVLKYGTASLLLPVILTGNELKTTTITATDIQSLNIPDNKASDVVQVYLQTGSTQTLAGSIIVKPTAEITGINPNIGSIVKYNDLITITGKHLSSNLGDFELKLNNDIIPLISTNGSSIQFRIPANIEAKTDSIYIKMNTIDLQKDIKHYHIKIAPTITSISPTSGSDNTVIIIQGYNFGSKDTIVIDTNHIPTSSTNLQTISFALPAINNLQAGMSYPIKVKTNGDSVISSTAFTYMVGSLNIVDVQSLYIDTSHIRIAGTGLKNTTLYLRYNNGAYFPIDTMTTTYNSIYTKPIGQNTINLLGIPANVSSVAVGVYVLAGSTYTFVGNINIKAITKLYPITSKPTLVGSGTLSIQGEHIMATDNYRIGLSRIPNDTAWFAPTSLNTTTLNLILSDTLTADEYSVNVKYKNMQNDTLVNLNTIIIKPTISSIAPNSNIDTIATSTNTFVITGKNLSANSNEIITLLNGVDKSTNFTIQNATQTSISVVYKNSLTTPTNTTAITYSLSLKINGQISSPSNISLKR